MSSADEPYLKRWLHVALDPVVIPPLCYGLGLASMVAITQLQWMLPAYRYRWLVADLPGLPNPFQVWAGHAFYICVFWFTPIAMIVWTWWGLHKRKPVVHNRRWMLRNMALGAVFIPPILFSAGMTLIWLTVYVQVFIVRRPVWLLKNAAANRAEWMYGVIPSAVLLWCWRCWRKARRAAS